ncbi:hypothetical protein G5B37_12095 [Rasiella rasia]|uniref:Uncharacterized protein n=1 Tax=Rasiella rasia TaxID=2744027 RepID=A0A6G6GNW1_9FLAO|nr:hypothetical protein [Rasiella rasia]QIE60275.1 hypothetical protein G5B37_12095 [Rasiella rasia]
MILKLPHLQVQALTVIILTSLSITAQVGVGTVSPDPGSLLDIESTDKGILVPRVSIANLNTIAPITGGATESLLVYNTNTTTGKGYYYWDSTQWVAMNSMDWKLRGNSGTDENNDFVGTLDGEALTFRTNNIQRFRVANDDQVQAMANGSAARPFYSWNADQTMGFWRSGTRQMDMVINGSTFFNANANTGGGSDLEWSFNPGGVDMNLRVETDNNANSLFVHGEEDNIGFGTNAPNSSAQLDMAAINKGILINRVALTATTSASPVTTPATGLMVYNTATASSGGTQVLPGFYYWDSTKWVAMGGTNGRDWSLDGNAGTNPSSNFLGTTDATDLVVRTQNLERLRISADGNGALGSAPYSNVGLRVNKSGEDYGILGETTSNLGAAVAGFEAGTGDGVLGQNTGTGTGVFGYAVQNYGVLGLTPYTGGMYLTAGVVGWGSGANNANGMLSVTSNVATTQQSVSFRAISGGTTSYSPTTVLNIGVNSNSPELAFYGQTEGPITSLGDLDAAEFTTNYTGIQTDADARDPRALLAGRRANATTPLGTALTYYGAYLYSGGSNSNSSYAYAGARHNNVNYKIIGNGIVSTIVDGINADDKKIMFAPEAPEVLFEDYGTGSLHNGTADITIDPIFSKNIIVDAQHPLKVFIQLEGDCNGVFVTNKTANGFRVKELQGGTSTVAFSWHIVANRKDDVSTNASEGSAYSSLRFPDAPSMIVPEGKYATTINEKDSNKKLTPFQN